jgi:hypothetical protein
MKNFHFYFLLCLLLICSCSFNFVRADDNSEVEIRQIAPDSLKIEPGKALTLSYLVINHTGSDLTVREELILPPNCRVIVPLTGFQIKAHDQQVRLVSIVFPNSAISGSYLIHYSLTQVQIPVKTYTNTVNVSLMPVTHLKSIILEKPGFVIAGEEYTVTLQYQNTGNSALHIQFAVDSSLSYFVQYQHQEMILQPGEYQRLDIKVKTDAKIETNVSHLLTVKAYDPKSEVTYCEDTIGADIVPTINGLYDPFHRIPSLLQMTAGIDGNSPGYKLEFAGNGSMDDAGNNKAKIYFVASDFTDQNPNQGIEHLQLSLENQRYGLNIGDSSFILSPLTRRWDGRYNINLNVTNSRSVMGFIYPEKDGDNPDGTETGLYYQYQFNPKFVIRTNFLNSAYDFQDEDILQNNRIYSLQAEIRPFGDNTVNLEYALDNPVNEDYSLARAYHFDIHGQTTSNRFNYSMDKIYAAPDFFGNYHDTDLMTFSAAYSLPNQDQISFFYHANRDNLNLDPQNSSRDESYYNAVFSHEISSQTQISSTLSGYRSNDLLPLPGEKYDALTLKLALQQNYSKWRLGASVEGGRYDDKLDNSKDNDITIYGLTIDYSPGPGQSYLLYANIGNHSFPLLLDSNNNIGVMVDLRLKNNLGLNFQYQRSNFLWDPDLERDYLIMNWLYTYKQFSWSLKLSQISTSDDKDFEGSLLVTYTLPVNIPVTKRTDICVLKGKVFDAEQPDHPPLEKVILIINGVEVVTNKQGEFTYTARNPGKYSILMNQTLIGLDRVPVQSLPLVVELKKGEVTPIDIGMVRAAKVHGKTIFLETKPKDKASDVYIAGTNLYSAKNNQSAGNNPVETKTEKPLVNTVVELTDGSDTFQTIADENGEFTFTGIRPGNWRIKVYDDGLIENYSFENTEFEFDLKPGDTKEIVFRAAPVIRKIQIIEEGVIQ